MGSSYAFSKLCFFYFCCCFLQLTIMVSHIRNIWINNFATMCYAMIGYCKNSKRKKDGVEGEE